MTIQWWAILHLTVHAQKWKRGLEPFVHSCFWCNMPNSQEIKATESIFLWMNWLAKDGICLQWSMTQSFKEVKSAIQIDLEDMLNEISHALRDKFSMVPLVWDIENKPIQKQDREEILPVTVGAEKEGGRKKCLMGRKVLLKVLTKFWVFYMYIK